MRKVLTITQKRPSSTIAELPESCLEKAECFFFKYAPIGIAEIDTGTGEIINANEAYFRMLKRTREEVVGNNWMSFTPKGDLLREIDCYRILFIERNKQYSYPKHYRLPDGTLLSVYITAVALDDNPKRRRHLVMVQQNPADKIMDIENRQAMQTSWIARNAIINSLVSLSQFRDRETGEHLYRTKLYVYLLLELSGSTLPFSRYGKQIVAKASMLHDIGKVGIPDAVLLKKGPLNHEERELIKTHTTMGAATIREALKSTGYDISLLYAKDIIEYHHERWDGAGYPHGLKGEEIPITARIMAIADVYDALRSERPYKRALPHEDAVRMIRDEAGSHFDPELTRLFLENERLFFRVSVTTPGNNIMDFGI